MHVCLVPQDALHLDGDAAGAGSVGDGDAAGSDLDDLDDYINKLDAGVMTFKAQTPPVAVDLQGA